MGPEIQQLLFRHQRQALDQIAELVPEAHDLDPASFFEQFAYPGEAGFRNQGCSGTGILLPGPKEAENRAHLHIEEHYDTRNPHVLKFYRYEICWSFDFVLTAPPNDHVRDSIIVLRRGVRFDHHPHFQDPHHPTYHWHPNGCSEFRLSTGEMSPLKVAIVASLMFDRARLNTLESTRITKAIEELRREIPCLPWDTNQNV